MDLTGMGETSNSTNHDRKELRWLWVWAFLLLWVCVCVCFSSESHRNFHAKLGKSVRQNRTKSHISLESLDTLKTKTRCQANGIPRKLLIQGIFFVNMQSFKCQKQKCYNNTLIIFEKYSRKHTGRQVTWGSPWRLLCFKCASPLVKLLLPGKENTPPKS